LNEDPFPDISWDFDDWLGMKNHDTLAPSSIRILLGCNTCALLLQTMHNLLHVFFQETQGYIELLFYIWINDKEFAQSTKLSLLGSWNLLVIWFCTDKTRYKYVVLQASVFY
jgi:hypothetical protein